MTATASPTRANGAARQAGLGGKYLTFYLRSEEYGLEILKVHEIIGMMAITPVPRTPEYVRGVINLRGKVIPTIDLRLKFDMMPVEQTDQTCIIVVQVSGMQIGVVVDRVSEVSDIADTDIEDVPCLGSDVDISFLLGMGKCQGRVRLLLDIEKVLTAGDIADLSGFALEDDLVAA